MLQLQQRMKSLHRIDKFGESLEHYELGNYEKAAELLKALLDRGGLTEQEQALVHYRIGLSHSMLQENQLAIRHYRKSFEFSEGVPLGGIPAQVPSEFGLFVITNIASIYLRQGRIMDALIYYTYVKEHLDPESSQYPLLLRNIARAERVKSRYKPPKTARSTPPAPAGVVGRSSSGHSAVKGCTGATV